MGSSSWAGEGVGEALGVGLELTLGEADGLGEGLTEGLALGDGEGETEAVSPSLLQAHRDRARRRARPAESKR